MNLPTCVLDCPDAILKSEAITAFTRGNAEEKAAYMLKCMRHNQKNLEQEMGQKRLEEMEKWIKYLSHKNSV